MHPSALQDRCARRLRGIEIPRPFRLDVFAATVAQRRRRPLRILPLPGLDGSDGLSGAWLATDTADYVLIDADASPWHRNLIGLHEIAHLLCGHDAEDSGLRELAEDLLPCLSDAAIRRILGRHGRSGTAEQEAELMACLILKRADAGPLPIAATGTAGVAGRPAHARGTACLGAAMSVASVLFWRASRVSLHGTLRWGLWLLATGTSAGACYAAYQTARLFSRASGTISAADARALLADGVRIAAIGLTLAGLSVPASGAARQAATDLASLRALRGLRRGLAVAVPGAAADHWERGAAGSVRDPRIRLIRRTAEIRDAALALRRHVPAGTAAESRRRLSARGLTGTALDAAAEACWLELAIRAARAGAPAAESAHVLPGGATLQEEVRWLRQVAAAVHSRHVQAVAAELSEAPLAHPGGDFR